MSSEMNNLYEFGDFRFNTGTNTLWRGEELIALSPKALELLKLLVERGGEIVSKREIFDSIWADTFVEEGVLTQNIYTLRHALGTDENGKQFIENIARRGYRFVAPLKTLQAAEAVSKNGKQSKAVFFDGAANLPAESAENNLNSSSATHPSNNLQFLAASQIPSAPEKKIRPRSVSRLALLAGFGVLILSALGFGIYQFAVRRDEKSEARISPIEQLRVQRLTDSGDVVYPTVSPNGELLAFVRLGEQEASVWVKQIATGGDMQILPPSRRGYRSLAFSPDGSHLFFSEAADAAAIFQTSVLGGTPKKVAENVWSDFSVSPDGKQFAFIRRDTERNAHLLILSNIDGSGERELSARQSPLDYRGGAPAWSPDGSKLIVASLSGQVYPLLLTVEVSDGKESELKTPQWRAVTRILWTTDGKHLIVAARAANEPSSQLWMIDYPDGEVRRLTNDLESYFWISLSADGRMVVTRQQSIVSHLWLLPEGDIKTAKQLTFGERSFDGYSGLARTPDGKIVFAALTGNNNDLYLMNADGGNRIQLTANAGQANTYPAVSRDGRFVVFNSNRTGTTQIWRMDLDGRNQKQLTFGTEEKERAQFPAISPDDAEVFFIKLGVGPPAIWKVPVEGGDAMQVSRLTNATTEGLLSISPDGRWIAFRHVSVQPETISEERTMQIGVLPTDGNAELKLFDLPLRRSLVQWSADSAAFDYSAGTFNSSALMRQPLAGGEPQKLLDFPDRVFNFAWSSDNKNLVVSRGKQRGDAILITNLF